MNINLSAEQLAEIERQRAEFNRFTGRRYSAQRYVEFILFDALRDNGGAANLTAALFRGAENAVH